MGRAELPELELKSGKVSFLVGAGVSYDLPGTLTLIDGLIRCIAAPLGASQARRIARRLSRQTIGQHKVNNPVRLEYLLQLIADYFRRPFTFFQEIFPPVPGVGVSGPVRGRAHLPNQYHVRLAEHKLSIGHHHRHGRIWAEEPWRLIEYNRQDVDLTHELFARVLRGDPMFLGNATVLLPPPKESDSQASGNR